MGLALLVAGGAFVANVAAARAAAGPARLAVVAATTIRPGQRLTAADVRLRPVQGVPHTLGSLQAVIGKAAPAAFLPGCRF